jgi:hypothetical protein
MGFTVQTVDKGDRHAVDDTYTIDLLSIVGIPERTVVFQISEDEEFEQVRLDGLNQTRQLVVGENALSNKNIVLTVTGATEFRDDVRFNRNDHIVDFKTAPDKVFDVGVPNKVSNILIDDATGATTIGSDVRTDGILVLDERRGRIEPVSGDYSDSALQYLSRSVIKRDSDTKAVRYEGQLPQVDGMDADFYSDFNTDSWVYPVSCVATLVDNFVTVVSTSLKSLPVTGDVLTFDDDTIATVLSSAAESSTTWRMTVDVEFDSIETTKIIKRVKLADVQMYDIANVSKLSVAALAEIGRTIRVVDSETARIHTLEFADNAVRPLGLENEFKVYISDPATIANVTDQRHDNRLPMDVRFKVHRRVLTSPGLWVYRVFPPRTPFYPSPTLSWTSVATTHDGTLRTLETFGSTSRRYKDRRMVI